MTNKDNFYIGWQDEMPKENSRFLKKWVLLIFIVLPVLVFILVSAQKKFRPHVFQLGNLTTLTGTYYQDPFPMLLVNHGLPSDSLSNEVLLVGFGKSGAEGTMKDIQDESGDLNGKEISLKGTLIFGDGKTLLELTKKKKSLVEVKSTEIKATPTIPLKNPIKLQGEIMDPKCYFGVMKPGEGKIHKSCAIRCISGGIPPVFRHETNNHVKPYEYYVMKGKDGTSVGKEILDFVGEPVTIEGEASSFLNWNLIYLDPTNIKLQN